MSDPTPPAVSDALREAVAPYIALFDVAYRKACEGSMEPDWCNAALLGQQMRNAFFKAIGPDGPIASEIARLTGERDAAHAVVARLTQGRDNPPVTNGQKVSFSEFLHANARAEAAEADLTRMRAETERLEAERDELIGALEDTRAAAADLVPVCLVEGDNKAAGALQFVSGFISDRLAALSNMEQTDGR